MRALLALVACAACSRAAESPPAPSPSPPAPAVATPDPPKPVESVKPAKVAPPRPAELVHVTIKALGMYCEESCPIRVRSALADITSVYELGFDLTKESVFVSYDKKLGTPVDVTRPMLAAIKAAGFDPWLAKETWPPNAQAEAQVVAR